MAGRAMAEARLPYFWVRLFATSPQHAKMVSSAVFKVGQEPWGSLFREPRQERRYPAGLSEFIAIFKVIPKMF